MLSNLIKINDAEFLELRDIIYKNSAISMVESKKYLLENRLSKRMHELNFSTFKDYIYYLKYDINGKKEMVTMINLVTINETYFLRERPQIDYMVKKVIPDLIAEGKRSIRIWSAACSTGEEPYSIAILIDEAGLNAKANIEVVGTDINTDVVNIAKEGLYRSMSFRGTPENFTNRYFTKKDMAFLLSPEIKKRVKFTNGNLLAPGMSVQAGRFDIIFCRNVIIYFDAEAKKKVLEMFHSVLNKPGFLFLGHSENINKLTDVFELHNFGGGMIHLKK